MKKLIALIVLTSTLARADQTNILVRITIESVVGGVTNSVNTNLNLDNSTAKDRLLVDGAISGYQKAVAGGSQITLGAWIRQDTRDRLMEYAKAKLVADNADLASRLTKLLTEQLDNLSAQNLNDLISIGAKAQ